MYLEFEESLIEANRKTKLYNVKNKDNFILGYITFRPQWRCYIFRSNGEIALDIKCMTEIIEKLKEENSLWRNNLSKG